MTTMTQANANSSEALTEEQIRDWEEKRMREAMKTVELSIALHRGTQGACDEYHELEQEQKALLWKSKPQWPEITEKRLPYLAVD